MKIREFHPSLDVLEGRVVPSTYTVTNLNSFGQGSFNWAIDASNETIGPNVINFSPSLYGTITPQRREILVQSVTIQGPVSGGLDRITLDFQSSHQGFGIVGGLNVEIDNLIVSHGWANRNTEDFRGGAIANYGSNLVLNGDIFSFNSAGSLGGALYTYAGITNAYYCQFQYNSAAFAGGAIATTGGGTGIWYSNVIGNSTYYGDYGNYSFGGGIFTSTGYGTWVGYSTIMSNFAARHGGGIFDANHAPLYLISDFIANNLPDDINYYY